MNDPTNEIFAKLTMLEFAVEVLFANALADRPFAESQAFKHEFIHVSSIPTLPEGEVSTEQEQLEALISQRVVQMAEHLMVKVDARESDIREQRSQA